MAAGPSRSRAYPNVLLVLCARVEDAHLGYTVNPAAADPYTLPGPTVAAAKMSGRRFVLRNDVYTGPTFTVDAAGRITMRPTPSNPSVARPFAAIRGARRVEGKRIR